MFWSTPFAFAEPAPRKSLPMPHFAESARILRENRAIYSAYEDSVYARLDEQTWVDLMFRRAAVCQKLYPQNNKVIDEITDYFNQNPKRIPSAAYDSLFSILMDLGGFDDVFLLEQFTNVLLPHYEAKKDVAHLLKLNHYAGYCYADITRAYQPEMKTKALEYFKRNIEYGRRFASLDQEAASVIPRDYINICYYLASLGAISPEEGLAYTDDFEQFLEKNKVHFSEEDLSFYTNFLEYIRTTSFRIYSMKKVEWTAADTTALLKMFAASPFASGTLANLSSLNDSLCYYHTMAMLGKMSVRQAYQESDKLEMKIFERFGQLDKIEERDLMDIVDGLIITFSLMEKSHESEFFMSQRVTYFIFQLIDMIQRLRIVGNYVFFDYILSGLASEKVVINHLPAVMKEQFMNKIAVKSQVGTVVHVNMVERLCVTLFDALLDKHPEIFTGIMNYQTSEELLSHRSELMQYLSMAALFHDLGKAQMSEIVGNSFRRLTDHEYDIIKMHPEKSLAYFDLDPLFETYRDVALGHHQGYNGMGGYPASFNNVLSPWRSFIDLVTICDCIDAATDYLDRNYRMPKTFEQVMDEMIADAGIRYNPDIVKAIVEDKELFERMNNIIIGDRPRHASMVRARYIYVKKEN